MTINNLFEIKKGLETLMKEDFKDTGIGFAYDLKIYMNNTHAALYNPKEDTILIKYVLNNNG